VQTPAANTYQFGPFEVHPASGELLKKGVRVKLQDQPFRLLIILLEGRGEVVTREEIQNRIWQDNTFVDFDASLRVAVRKLREALGDDADHPQYIETVTKRGYRFAGEIQLAGGREIKASESSEAKPAAQKKTRSYAIWIALTAGVLVIAVVGALQWGRYASVPQINSLAVLPLANLSGDPRQEYFADGMTDELITALGQIQQLRVISRTSVMAYKGTPPKGGVRDIARELNVDAVVEGSVIRAGDRVRITAQLIDARSDRHLWAQSYEREMRDVLDLQGEVARNIADQVQAKLAPDAEARLAQPHPVDPEAHELYLKGQDFFEHTQAKKALEYFEQAVQKDPNFARGYLGIARAYGTLGDSVELASHEAYAKQKMYALKALELDESLDEAHVILARALRQGDWDWKGSERELERALEINHNSASAYSEYSFYLPLLGRTSEALAQANHLQEIEPNSWRSHQRLGWVYYFSRRYDEALVEFNRAREIGGPNPWRLFYVGWAYRQKRMYREAIAEFTKIPADLLPSAAFSGHLGVAYARAGNRAEAERIVRMLRERAKKEDVGTFELAFLCGALGKTDEAFEWLERSYQLHDKGMTFLKVEPAIDELRSDPRFQTYLDRMNFPR
jgi:TolB-like protein/DNA-binding winged helix-turn-helix (wHTH) protein/Tfp pilus assembly protein PilF